MDITRESCLAALDTISSILSHGSIEFVAIDLEMSGLRSGPDERKCGMLDSPDDHYLAYKSGSEANSCVQLGLALFARNEEDPSRFLIYPFNFYVFGSHPLAPSYHFQSDSSSLAFLRSQGFDFNRLVDHGCYFLRKSENEGFSMKKRSDLDTQLNRLLESEQPLELDNAEDRAFVRDLIQSCKEHFQIVENKAGELRSSSPDIPPPLDVRNSNPFRRRIIYNTIRSTFSGVLSAESCVDPSTSSEFFIRIFFSPMDLMENIRHAKMQENERTLREVYGLSALFDILLEHSIPCVLHNGLYDLLFVYNQFIAPLPPTLNEFRSVQSKNLFPRIYDTKLIASEHPDFRSKPIKGSSTALGDLFSKGGEDERFRVSSLTEFEFATGFDKYVAALRPQNSSELSSASTEEESCAIDSFSHEAAFDAVMTGCVFARMVNYLRKDSSVSNAGLYGLLNHDDSFGASMVESLNKNCDSAEGSTSNLFSVISPLSPYEDRVFLSRSRVCLYVGPKHHLQAQPDLSRFFQLSSFDPSTDNRKITDWVRPTLGKHRIFWQDDTTAAVEIFGSSPITDEMLDIARSRLPPGVLLKRIQIPEVSVPSSSSLTKRTYSEQDRTESSVVASSSDTVSISSSPMRKRQKNGNEQNQSSICLIL